MADSLAWDVTSAGIVLPVLAQPGAKRNGVKGVRQGQLIVAVTQAPEKGKANEAIIEVLAEFFQIKRRQITLLSGATNPRKRFVIADAEIEELQRLVAVLLSDAG